MLEPNFTPFPELTTERLLLRRLSSKDAQEVFLLRSDKSAMAYIAREPATTIKEAENFIVSIDENIDSNKSVLWAIALKNNPTKLIGTICLWQIRPEDYRAEIGYAILPEYWRKGYAKEALLTVIDYGFNIMRLHSIDAHVDPRNKGSIAAIESVGFVREAYFREIICFRGEFLDETVYSKLRSSLNH